MAVSTEIMRLAINIARNRGWPVFPCRWEKKNPACPNSFEDARVDEEGITELWNRYPGELIGIPTGAQSGFDVLDLDFAKHPISREWKEAAWKRGVPETRGFQTRSGGEHWYFRHAPDVRNSTSKLAEGVDVRGDGGYIIFWFASGFHCICHEPIAPWPAWLLKCVLWKKPELVVQTDGSLPAEDADVRVARVVKFIAEGPPGDRNGRVFWGTKRLIEEGHISRAEIENLVLAAAATAGHDAITAKRTVASAMKGAR